MPLSVRFQRQLDISRRGKSLCSRFEINFHRPRGRIVSHAQHNGIPRGEIFYIPLRTGTVRIGKHFRVTVIPRYADAQDPFFRRDGSVFRPRERTQKFRDRFIGRGLRGRYGHRCAARDQADKTQQRRDRYRDSLLPRQFYHITFLRKAGTARNRLKRKAEKRNPPRNFLYGAFRLRSLLFSVRILSGAGRLMCYAATKDPDFPSSVIFQVPIALPSLSVTTSLPSASRAPAI